MAKETETRSWLSQARIATIVLGIFLPVLLIIVGVVLFLTISDESQTRAIRDIFLILLALEFMFVGIALGILVIQLARLSVLIELELRPMVISVHETIQTLQGTTQFLTENVVEPVIRLQSSLAGIQRILGAFGLLRKP